MNMAIAFKVMTNNYQIKKTRKVGHNKKGKCQKGEAHKGINSELSP